MVERKDIIKLRNALTCSNNGTAILFTGAGFSYGAKNIKGQKPKDGVELSFAICDLANIERDDDLYDASQICIDEGKTRELIKLLREEYQIKNISTWHEKISSKKWRRVYTTNYDHVFEIASKEVGVLCESVNISKSEVNFDAHNQCVHLNGTVEDLSETELLANFKLSDSSYVSPDTLLHSKWKNVFRTDLSHATAVFFVGYSMYDLDIKRILRNDEYLKEKTFFIVKPGEKDREIRKLKRLGTVLDIGVEEFAALTDELISKDYTPEYSQLEAFKKKQPIDFDNRVEITDKNIIDLFVKGKVIESELYPSTKDDSYCLIKRRDFSSVCDKVNASTNIIVSGEIASGKTLFINQLSSNLTMDGRDVFELVDEEYDYINDIAIIEELANKPVFIIDNAFRHSSMILDIYSRFGDNATFILSGRNDFIERTKIELNKIGFKYIEHSVTFLNQDELYELNDICDFIGYWGENSGWSTRKKVEYLNVKCEGKMSTILLDFFRSDYVKDLLKDEFDEISKKNGNQEERNILLIVIILGMLPFYPSRWLVSDLSYSDIPHSIKELEKRKVFKSIIATRDDKLAVSSGIMARFVLDTFFTGDNITKKLIELISEFDELKKGGPRSYREVFKELMRFKNVNYMLPDKGRGTNLTSFYQKLKKTIPWLKYSPQYWLQYGMAHMFLGDYVNSKKNFDNAYGCAKDDKQYYTDYIDNQMARWHLEVGLKETNNEKAVSHFRSAYSLLHGLNVDYYYCKQLNIVSDYNKKFDSFSVEHKKSIVKVLKLFRHDLKKENYDRDYEDEIEVNKCRIMIESCIAGLEEAIDEISEKAKTVAQQEE